MAKLGDRISHDATPCGTIITASRTRMVDNRFVARLGDKCFCDQHGPTVIVVVDLKMPMTDGRLTAHSGSKTACGAYVLPSINKTFEDNAS